MMGSSGFSLQDPVVRLRLGGALIVALLWLYGLLELNDKVTLQQEAVVQAQRELVRLRAVAGETFWPESSETVRARIEVFRQRAWVEESEGAFRAVLQDWIVQSTRAHGLTLNSQNIRAELPAADDATQPELPENLRVVHVDVVLTFDGPKLVEFLAALYAESHLFWVEKLAFNTHGDRHVTLELGTLFSIGKKAGDG